MYARLLEPELNNSFFLFGPRGTGKTTWLKQNYPSATYIDLLETQTYRKYFANPEKLESNIPKESNNFIVIDEIQRVPELLNEVHRLIESPKHYKFILTGSSARKLRKQGVNLLAGRAYIKNMYPLTAQELGDDFDLTNALKHGTLPAIYSTNDIDDYLQSYLGTYLEQEINQEAMTRNLSAFYRFLEVVSLSQGSPLNTTSIAREVSVHSKVVDNYFSILKDLLIGSYIEPFTRRGRRRLKTKPKFYLFDSGIYNTARPKGYIDTENEINGVALEILFLNNLRAVNDYLKLRYKITYFKTASNLEVDFVTYGENGFHAFEIKHARDITTKHLRGLKAFARDYPEAKLHVFYLGTQKIYIDDITVYPFEEGLKDLSNILKN